MPQSIEKQIMIFPPIEAELHFRKVRGEVLRADLVPASHDATFQERKRRFDSISRDASAVLVSDVFSDMMINDLVFGIANSVLVSRETVGNEHFNVSADVFADVLCQRPALGIFGMEESQITVALSKSDDYFFVGESCTLTAATIFPANVGFVYFDSAIEHGLICFFHGSTDAMTEVPCRFVAHSQGALDLIRRHSLARFAQKQSSEKPLLQREMGVIENSAGGHGELIIAVLAIEQLLCRRQLHGGHLTARAFDASGPPKPDKQLAAFFVSVKEINNVNQSHRDTSMDAKQKREELKKVPTRKLLASIKRDLRGALRASASAPKPKKK